MHFPHFDVESIRLFVMVKTHTLGRKILLSMVAIVLGMLIIAGLLFYFAAENLTEILTGSNIEISRTAGDMSYSSMSELTKQRMQELAAGKADLADGIFSDFKRSVQLVASVAENI